MGCAHGNDNPSHQRPADVHEREDRLRPRPDRKAGRSRHRIFTNAPPPRHLLVFESNGGTRGATPRVERKDRMFDRDRHDEMAEEPGRNDGRVLSRRDWLHRAGLASMAVASIVTLGAGPVLAADDQRPGGRTRPGAGGPPSGDGGSGRPGKPPGAGGGAPDGSGSPRRPGAKPPGTGGGPPSGGGDGARRPGSRPSGGA